MVRSLKLVFNQHPMICLCCIFTQDIGLKSPDFFFLGFDFEIDSYSVTK